MGRLSFTALLVSALFLGACGTEAPVPLPPPADAGPRTVADSGVNDAGIPAPPVDPTEAVFAANHLIDVTIDLAAPDWELLRNEARTFADLFGPDLCIDSPPTSPYTWFPARVTIDGQTLDDVGVRKKGFFGSVNPVKPSLKLSFDKFVPSREFSGFERMTLNNGRQGGERSLVRQCLGYHLFAAAGIAAPRCNYARVRVNGEAYGVYAHVEDVKKRMIGRFFNDREGALYEGAISDFRPLFVDTFERKTNEHITDRSDLAAVADALEADDSVLLDRLAPLIDLDEFIMFWALEVLIGHWDGYSGRNHNNFYIYRNPETGRFHFIPWGIDATFGHGPPGALEPVYAYSLLARRLYFLPSTRAQFLTRMTELLEAVWDENSIYTEIRETEMLIRSSILPSELTQFDATLQQLRNFVMTRRDVVTAELAGGGPQWERPLSDPICLNPIGELRGSFDTTWGTFPTNNPFGIGSGTLTATVSGNSVVGEAVSIAAGVNQDGLGILQVVAGLPGNAFVALAIYMSPDRIVAGASVPLEIGGGSGALLFYIPSPGAPAQQVGQVGMGRVTFEAASTANGASVVGSFSGLVFQ